MRERRFGTNPRGYVHAGAYGLVSEVTTAVVLGLILFSATANSGEVNAEKREKITHDLRTVEVALQFFRLDHGAWPSTEQGLSVLVQKPKFGIGVKNWRRSMKELPVDPWGQNYFYRVVDHKTELDTRTFVLKCLGPDGVESDDDIEL